MQRPVLQRDATGATSRVNFRFPLLSVLVHASAQPDSTELITSTGEAASTRTGGGPPLLHLKWDAFFMPGNRTTDADDGMRFTPGRSMLPLAAAAAGLGETWEEDATAPLRRHPTAPRPRLLQRVAAAALGCGRVSDLTEQTQHIARSKREPTLHGLESRRQARHPDNSKATTCPFVINSSCCHNAGQNAAF